MTNVADTDRDEHTDDEPPITAVTLRHPAIPVTLGELASLRGEALEVIEARVQILSTLRASSIRATSPPDWLLNRAGETTVGYLQDCGCDRVRDLWGIEIFGVSEPQKVNGDEAGVFHYLVRGSGRCKLTQQTVDEMEGGRSSTDDFCKDKRGVELELLVRKAARANLDGNITRELAGLKSVPVEDLKDAWTGTRKTVEQCRLGKGFGTQTERYGGTREGVPDVPPPVCPHCKAVGAYRPAKGDRGAFYGCPNYQKHPQQKWIQDAADWVRKQQQQAAAAKPAPEPPAAAAPEPPPAGRVERELHADEIFNKPPNGARRRDREPGQEG